MKDFYISVLGLELVSESKRNIFLKAGKSMLLIFNPEITINYHGSIFPIHGAITPPPMIHFALEIEEEHYEYYKGLLMQTISKLKRN
jgi:catechol-2,3-dioxygenase